LGSAPNGNVLRQKLERTRMGQKTSCGVNVGLEGENPYIEKRQHAKLQPKRQRPLGAGGL